MTRWRNAARETLHGRSESAQIRRPDEGRAQSVADQIRAEERAAYGTDQLQDYQAPHGMVLSELCRAGSTWGGSRTEI